MRTLVAASLLIATTGVASAQSLADCRRIASDQDRLTCYDRLVPTDQALSPQLRPQIAAAPRDPAVVAAEGAVRGGLVDPASAKFTGVQRKGGAVCGFVNARNAEGGYAGSKLFVYVEATGETKVLTQPEDEPAGKAALAAYQQHCR